MHTVRPEHGVLALHQMLTAGRVGVPVPCTFPSLERVIIDGAFAYMEVGECHIRDLK
jgi:hypothetical protein